MRPRSGARRTRRSPIACARARSTSSRGSRSWSARAPRCGGRSRRTASPRRSSSGRRGPARRRSRASSRRARGRRFEELSAVSSGKADVQAVIGAGRERLGAQGQRTVLFIDEIHRFNKAQQDALLPVVESGLVTLIGATTENPFHSSHRRARLALPAVRVRGHSRGRPAGGARTGRRRAGRARPRPRRARGDRRRRPPAMRATPSRRSSWPHEHARLARRADGLGGGRRRGRQAPSRALRP